MLIGIFRRVEIGARMINVRLSRPKSAVGSKPDIDRVIEFVRLAPKQN
jgi:hypothetical protein